MKKIIVFSIILLFTFRAQATILIYKSFDNLIEEADGIVMGTVIKIEPYATSEGIFYTYVTLNNLQILSGSYDQKELTIRFQGGEIGDEEQYFIGSPNFQLKDRVILFVQGNGREIVPIVGWEQGVFRLQKESKGSTKEIVLDYHGNRVFSIESGHVIKEQSRRSDAQIVTIQNSQIVHVEIPDGGTSDPFSENVSTAESAGMSAMTPEQFIAEIQPKKSLQKATLKSLNSVTIGVGIEPENTKDARPDTEKYNDKKNDQAESDSDEVTLPKRYEKE